MASETKAKRAKTEMLISEKPMVEEQEDIVSEIPAPKEEIKELNLGFVEKQKFRINGDYNRILEICTSDLNVVSRYNEVAPKLSAFIEDVQKELVAIDDDDTDLSKTAEIFTKIDQEMRKCIDYIFDTNASEVCAPTGNMFDPLGGQFRYEHIIECLVKLYSEGIVSEFNKIKTKTAKYTDKYNKKKN